MELRKQGRVLEYNEGGLRWKKIDSLSYLK